MAENNTRSNKGVPTSSQKMNLKKEFSVDPFVTKDKAEYLEMLLQGPVYSVQEIKTIEENRNSIARWRTKK